MIILDASTLIAYLEPVDPHHQGALDTLSHLVGEPWALSTITLAEVLVGPARRAEETLSEAIRVLADLGIAEQPLPAGAGSALARLRAATGLRLPDCCVLLTAETADCALVTFDARLAAQARARGLTVHPAPD